jgi:hypothetical protein
MSDVRKIDDGDGFDQGTMAYINRFILYRRALGVIGEDVAGPWIRFDNLNRIEIPLGRSVTDVGFTPHQMVDVHTIFAVTGRPDVPHHQVITTRVLRPYSPPGCIQMCFEKKGKVEMSQDGSRVIDMDGSPGGIRNGGRVTLPPGATALDWVVEGVPYTVFEIYLIAQMYSFPEDAGRKLLLELAHLMNPGTVISS